MPSGHNDHFRTLGTITKTVAGSAFRRSRLSHADSAVEFQNLSLLPSYGPAMVSVGERDCIGPHVVHLLPILSAVDRVVHSGWANREHGGTRSAGHDRDAPAVSSGTTAALFPSLAAVIGIGCIACRDLRMVVVAADDHQTMRVHHGDREGSLVLTCDERRIGGGPSLARIGGVEHARCVLRHKPCVPAFLFSVLLGVRPNACTGSRRALTALSRRQRLRRKLSPVRATV